MHGTLPALPTTHNKNGVDIFTKAFASAEAARINDYWRRRGFDPQARPVKLRLAERMQVTGSCLRSSIWVVRSDFARTGFPKIRLTGRPGGRRRRAGAST